MPLIKKKLQSSFPFSLQSFKSINANYLINEAFYQKRTNYGIKLFLVGCSVPSGGALYFLAGDVSPIYVEWSLDRRKFFDPLVTIPAIYLLSVGMALWKSSISHCCFKCSTFSSDCVHNNNNNNNNISMALFPVGNTGSKRLTNKIHA